VRRSPKIPEKSSKKSMNRMTTFLTLLDIETLGVRGAGAAYTSAAPD